MKFSRRNVINGTVCIALVACASIAVGEQKPNDTLENVTVYGQKTLLNLRRAADRAQVEFFNRFNELNEDDQYDVYCEKIAKTGSRVRKLTCWSPFEREMNDEEMRFALSTGNFVGLQNEGMLRVKRSKQARLLQKMILETPELQELYTDYGNANIRFYTERKRRCSDNILCLEPKEASSDDD
jgi:hypothetical protein